MDNTTDTKGFYTLEPSRFLDAIELAMGEKYRATGRVLALNSIENRVYEIEFEDAEPLIAKFYRPGRWSYEQILEEHLFLTELDRAEIPVAPPIELKKPSQKNEFNNNSMGQSSNNSGDKISSQKMGQTLGQFGGQPGQEMEGAIWFALFPKRRGRHRDELGPAELRQAGRLLARIHAIGRRLSESNQVTHRLSLSVDAYGRVPLQILENDTRFQTGLGVRYLSVAKSLVNSVATRFPTLANGDRKFHLIHGDCHSGNLLWQQDSAFFLDFDDALIGPPVQDLWMMVRGRDEEARKQRDLILDGYEQMQAFDRDSLAWIEPLRALRMIHFAGWIAKRWEDPSFPRLFPEFASERWLQTEAEALLEIESLLDAERFSPCQD